MKKEIYVHIGIHKTGTTSIQKCLYDNADKLMAQGIYYPDFEGISHTFLPRIFSSKRGGQFQNKTKTEIERLNQKTKKILEKNIRNPKVNKIIFSSEDLSLLSTDDMQKFYNWLLQFSEHIILLCCVRNPFYWFGSAIQERLKSSTLLLPSGKVVSFNIEEMYKHILDLEKSKIGFLKSYYIYHRILLYIKIFNQDSMRLFDFDHCKSNLVRNFLALCDINESVRENLLPDKVGHMNSSISNEAAIMLNSFIRLCPECDSEVREQMRNYLFRVKGSKFKLPKVVLIKLLSSFKPDIEALAVKFPEQCGSYMDAYEKIQNYQDAEPRFTQETADSLFEIIYQLTEKVNRLESRKLFFKNVLRIIKRKFKNLLRRVR